VIRTIASAARASSRNGKRMISLRRIGLFISPPRPLSPRTCRRSMRAIHARFIAFAKCRIRPVVLSGSVEGVMKQVALSFACAAAALLAVPVMGQVAPAPQPIAVGQTVSGELNPNDAQRRSGKFEDV